MKLKTAKQLLVRLSPEERKMIDALLSFYAQKGFQMTAQDVMRKGVRTEIDRTAASGVEVEL